MSGIGFLVAEINIHTYIHMPLFLFLLFLFFDNSSVCLFARWGQRSEWAFLLAIEVW